jgi:hypothetical protein
MASYAAYAARSEMLLLGRTRGQKSWTKEEARRGVDPGSDIKRMDFTAIKSLAGPAEIRLPGARVLGYRRGYSPILSQACMGRSQYGGRHQYIATKREILAY